MTLKEEALLLRGTRVRAEFATVGALEGVLRFVTPKDMVVLADSRGFEHSYPLADLVDVRDARFQCAQCGVRVNRVFAGRDDPAELCTSCSRQRAQLLPPPSMACEDCGKAGAFRSPKTNAFRCAPCHVKADTLSGLGAERRVLEQLEKTDPVLGAACRGADQNDQRHDWKQLRKSRWRCRACHANAYQEPAAARVDSET